MSETPTGSTSPIALRELAAIPVDRIKGIGDKRLAGLREMGIETVLDLVSFYPRRWLDRTNEARVADLVEGREALVLVEVRSVVKRLTRNRKAMVTAQVGDGSGRLTAVFFNQPWREKQLREGLKVALYGKVERFRGA